MVLEIKRKFLLDEPLQPALKEDGAEFKQIDILQFYTKISSNEEIKFKKVADLYTKTKTIKKGLIKEEKQEPISKKEFEAALDCGVYPRISKSRFSFKLNNQPCSIDIYKDELCGLFIFEIEFMTRDDANEFMLPEFLQNRVLKEITDDENYTDRNLALFGKPDFKFSYKNSLKLIEKLGEFKLFFASSISTYDAIRMVLFQICRSMLKNNLSYLKSKDKNSLEKLCFDMEKTLFFLETFTNVIDEKVVSKFINEFKILHSKISNLIELNYALECAGAAGFELEKAFITKRQILEDEIRLCLSSEDFDELIKEWEIVLSDENDFYVSSNYMIFIKSSVAYNLRKLSLKVIKSLRSQNSKNAFSECKKLNVFLGYFEDLFMIKCESKLLKQTDKIIKIYKFISECKVFLDIKFDLKSSQNLDTFNKNINSQIKKSNKKIAKKSKNIIKNLHKLSRNLKVYYQKEI